MVPPQGSDEMDERPECTGFPAQNEQRGEGTEGEGRLPLSAAWISPDLLAETRRVWSKVYGRPVTQEEAVHILTNVRRLVEVLMETELEEESE